MKPTKKFQVKVINKPAHTRRGPSDTQDRPGDGIGPCPGMVD